MAAIALGTPYNIGSTAAAAGVSTTVVTAGTDANSDPTTMPASGDAVFVLVGISSAVTSVTGVTDSLSNTYTLSGKAVPTDSQACFVYECLSPASKPVSGTTFTVTWSGATAATSSVRVIGCSGVASSAADDQSGNGSGSSTTPSATAGGSLAQSSELAIAVCQSGSATAGVSSWGTFTQAGHSLRSGTGSYFGVATLATSSTAAPTASATLGAKGGWGMLLLTYKAATGGSPSLSITTSSPLPGGQVGVAYSDQLTASGGVTPYTWSISSGSLPAGLNLASGSGGGGSADIQYVGVNTGPQGAPTESQFASSYPSMGPIGCYKTFYTSLPSSWSGTLMDQITQAYPGVFCYISWSTQMSAAAIAAFIATIPHAIPAVGFCFDSEPENGGYSSGAAFVSLYNDQATKVHAAQPTTPVQLVMMTASFTNWYQTGGDNSYIPPASSVDVYGMDFYDRAVYWAGPDMSSTKSWKTWLSYVQNLGKPLALTEFGISGAGTDSAQNTRLQADWAYLKNAFGAGGSVSQSPLYVWLYWNTGGTAFGGSNINEFLGTQTRSTWAAIAATAGSQGGGGGGGTGTGGVISGTPTTAGTQTPTFKVTDSASNTATAPLSITITAPGTLAVTSTTLPGATLNAAYSTLLTASGGSPAYTWAVISGTLPAGLGLTGSTGLISGTPTATGTSSFTIQVTDSASNTATAAVSITVSAGLVVTTTSLPGATAGTAYSAPIVAVGGTLPYSYAVTSGVLPAGLSLDPVAGVISGTPTAGAPSFVVTVTDSANDTASVTLSISVSGTTGGTVGRRRFGGSGADYVVAAGSANAVLFDPGAVIGMWTALSGGTQVTDLTDTSGNPITTVTAASDALVPEFYGPAGTWKLAADPFGGAGPRTWILATDMGDLLSALESSFASLAPLPGLLTGGVPVWNGVAWQNDLVEDASVDPAAGIQVSKLQPSTTAQQVIATVGGVAGWYSFPSGTVTLNGATAVTVTAPAVTSASLIFLTIQSPAGTPGSPHVTARTPGTSFQVVSQAGDTSVCAWFILEP